MATKKTPVKFTSREFDTIKQDLVQHAKRSYPDAWKNFGEASFGSMVLDMVAGVGDMLSYYLDYQVNEMFLDNATETDNIVRLGNQLGYKQAPTAGSAGLIDIYCLVPANSTGLGPDENYMPTLVAGAEVSSDSGASFIISDDVRFDYSQNEVVVARVDETTGIPTHYAVKATGNVLSGQNKTVNITIGNYEKFKKVKISDSNVLEILSVVDEEGHEYVEVDYLSQDVVYREVSNRGSDSDNAPSILRPTAAPRRFVVEKLKNATYLQFGHGASSEMTDASVVEPSKISMQIHGRSYSTARSFDPSKLMSTDSLGVAPSNTTLTVKYRADNSSNSNVAVNSIKNLTNKVINFNNSTSLSSDKMSSVKNSIEVSNSSVIDGAVTVPDGTELKRRIKDSFATQDRAVTKQDLEAVAYMMPSKYGAIKRCHSRRVQCATRRNLEFYVLSEDTSGKLSTASDTLKQNLKMWLSERKMINDVIQISNAKIVNFGIEFTISAGPNENKYEVLNRALSAVQSAFSEPLYIGEPIYITDIYGILNKVSGVSDAKNVKLINKTGIGYSSTSININTILSADGLTATVPENVAFEVKYPSSDIAGSIS